ncbi:hypothetical protein BH10ACT3_BH10ACT3_21890 [soil metagenome]
MHTSADSGTALTVPNGLAPGRAMRPSTWSPSGRPGRIPAESQPASPSEPSLEEPPGATSEPTQGERRTALMATVAHDLRGPLTAMVLASEYLVRRKTELSDELAAAVDTLDDQISAYSRLVLDLLDISLLDNGTAQLDLQPVRIKSLCASVMQSYDHDVWVSIAEGAEVVTADPRRLRQAIANLLDNAHKYAGGATGIRVTRHPGGVSLSVEDAGPGLTSSDSARIYERFERGSQGLTGHVSGFGLGLALVAGQVRLHDGELWHEVVPTGGTRFVIALPDRRPTAPEPPA